MSFGQYISPELFDKDLPPDTPVRKGAVPLSELKKGAPVDSPRPSALARSIAIKRSTKKAAAGQGSPSSSQDDSPKGVLKRQENDLPRTKVNSGYRSSPRTSTASEESDVDVTPSRAKGKAAPDTDVEVISIPLFFEFSIFAL